MQLPESVDFTKVLSFEALTLELFVGSLQNALDRIWEAPPPPSGILGRATA